MRNMADDISTPHAVGDLVNLALSISDFEDDHEYWTLVQRLQELGSSATYGAALLLCKSDDHARRRLACHLLGRMTWNRPEERDEALAVLEDRAFSESHVQVLQAALIALGQLGDPRGLDAVIVRAEHPSPDVRLAVASSLPSLVGDPPRPKALEVLRALMNDPVVAVRDWATFGLGSQLDIDDDPTRAALIERLTDRDPVTNGEALVGLARRHDRRALDAVLEHLRHFLIGSYVVDAAHELADPRALPLLLELRDQDEVFGINPGRLDRAIESCRGMAPPTPVESDHPVIP